MQFDGVDGRVGVGRVAQSHGLTGLTGMWACEAVTWIVVTNGRRVVGWFKTLVSVGP